MITVNPVKFYFCKHCVCKKTKRQGYFNQTHTTSSTANSEGHKFPQSWSNQDDTTPTPTPTPTGTTASESAPPPSTPGVPPTPSTPSAHLGVVIPPLRPTNVLEETNDSSGLEFFGYLLSNAIIDYDAAWMSIAPDPPSFEY